MPRSTSLSKDRAGKPPCGAVYVRSLRTSSTPSFTGEPAEDADLLRDGEGHVQERAPAVLVEAAVLGADKEVRYAVSIPVHHSRAGCMSGQPESAQGAFIPEDPGILGSPQVQKQIDA